MVREHVVQQLYFGLTNLSGGRENGNECCVALHCVVPRNIMTQIKYFTVVSNVLAGVTPR